MNRRMIVDAQPTSDLQDIYDHDRLVALGKLGAIGTDGMIAEWQDFANCKGLDPNLFFPEPGDSSRPAKEVCRGCVVRVECLESSLQDGEKFGIWGGLSEQERRPIRRQRAMSKPRLID